MPGLCHHEIRVTQKQWPPTTPTIQTPKLNKSHETMTARINMELKKHNATSGLFPAKDEKKRIRKFPPTTKVSPLLGLMILISN